MLVLAGFMGAGKTTVGRLLATRLRVPFRDSDLVIEARAGRPIPEIFAADGEPAFRELEARVIGELLAGPDVVLALGGGAAGHQRTQQLLAGVPVAFLRVSFAAAMARVGGDANRPMLARPDLAEVYRSRQEQYASVATVTVDVDGRAPHEIAGQVLAGLGAARPGPAAQPASGGRAGVAERAFEDTDLAWGDRGDSESEGDRLRRDRPPHWADY